MKRALRRLADLAAAVMARLGLTRAPAGADVCASLPAPVSFPVTGGPPRPVPALPGRYARPQTGGEP